MGREGREYISWSLTRSIQNLRPWPGTHFAWRRLTKVLHNKSGLWDSFVFVTTAEWCFGLIRFLFLNGKVCGGQEKRSVEDHFLKQVWLYLFFFPDFWLNPGVIGSDYTYKVHSLHYLSLVTDYGRLGKRHVTCVGQRDLNPWSWLWAGCAQASSRLPATDLCMCAWFPCPTQPHDAKETSDCPSLTQKGDVRVAQQWNVVLDISLLSLWTTCSKPATSSWEPCLILPSAGKAFRKVQFLTLHFTGHTNHHIPSQHLHPNAVIPF